MLETFHSLRNELTAKKQVEVDQTSAFKPGTSQAAVNLDLPPPSQPPAASNLEQMEVEYGPALPPHLGADHHMTSDQPSSPAEEPCKKASVRPKTHSHSHKKHVVDPRSASDQLTEESDEPQIASSRSKKHADKRKHKVRSRYVSSSQRRISPLLSDTGLLSPLGLSPLGLPLIKTYLNMIQNPLIMGK